MYLKNMTTTGLNGWFAVFLEFGGADILRGRL
jgi:hypothetical protein